MKVWKPAIEPTRGEQLIIKRCKGRRVFVSLRELWHRISDEEIQSKLQAAYSKVERGDEQVPSAQLGLAVLLQAAAAEASRA